MSDYDHRPGGSLKLKGDGEKKKKKKSHSSSDRAKVDSHIEEKDKVAGAGVGAEGSKAGASGGRKLTEAERRFEETQRKRREERAAKGAKTSHKDRVSEFNAKLDRLSEHHDMPRDKEYCNACCAQAPHVLERHSISSISLLVTGQHAMGHTSKATMIPSPRRFTTARGINACCFDSTTAALRGEEEVAKGKAMPRAVVNCRPKPGNGTTDSDVAITVRDFDQAQARAATLHNIQNSCLDPASLKKTPCTTADQTKDPAQSTSMIPQPSPRTTRPERSDVKLYNLYSMWFAPGPKGVQTISSSGWADRGWEIAARVEGALEATWLGMPCRMTDEAQQPTENAQTTGAVLPYSVFPVAGARGTLLYDSIAMNGSASHTDNVQGVHGGSDAASHIDSTLLYPMQGARRTGMSIYPNMAGPSTSKISVDDLQRHQNSANGPTGTEVYDRPRIGSFPIPGSRPARRTIGTPDEQIFTRAQLPSPNQPSASPPALGDSISAFLREMPSDAEDPTRHVLWTELIKLKTRTLELQIAEAKRKEKEAELELQRFRSAVEGVQNGGASNALANFDIGALLEGTAPQVQSGSANNGQASSFQTYPFVNHAQAATDNSQNQPSTYVPASEATNPALMATSSYPQVQIPMTPFDLQAMMQDENIDSMFSWLPDLGDSTQNSYQVSTGVDPSNLLVPAHDPTSFPNTARTVPRRNSDAEASTAISPNKRRSASPDSQTSTHHQPSKKAKKTEKKIVSEHSSLCRTCHKSVARVLVRAPKSQLPDPISVDLNCLDCGPVAQPPTFGDPATGGSEIGTVETRKRQRIGVEIEDEELKSGSRRVFCDVCQRIVGSGMIFGGKDREGILHMAEIQISEPSLTAARCTDCGGGGGPRIGIGKWRMKQVFQPGRKTCSLSHSRLGDRPREIGVHVTPTGVSPEQLKEIVARCKALWNEKSLARLAVPEMLEIDLPPHLFNPLKSYADVEATVTRNWPTREAMIKGEDADPERFKRLLGLTWAHSRPRRNVRSVDLEEEYAKTVEADDDPDMNTVLANVKRTHVVIPAGSELIGMWGGEWDMLIKLMGISDGSLLVSTFIPFEGQDGEDSTALSVGELITKVQSLQQKINAERVQLAAKTDTTPSLLPQCEHLWVVSGGTIPLVRERLADILVRKRSFVHVDEYLTRHPDFINSLNARPGGMHPDLIQTSTPRDDVQGPEGKPLILARWLGKDFDAQKILEIKQQEFGGKAKLRRRPKSRV
ncbi:hypothetical protein BCR39DRAFT_504009 [Naematelia encephala]|uniref:Uncharacterized protein n=1 Tax=Naematelia encephala TaxID=71784 RepID=A0A1Y2BDV0_9TREE|nr:hypothetical protein BCR39DRAFT_504009 [Naematelia encephala]